MCGLNNVQKSLLPLEESLWFLSEAKARECPFRAVLLALQSVFNFTRLTELGPYLEIPANNAASCGGFWYIFECHPHVLQIRLSNYVKYNIYWYLREEITKLMFPNFFFRSI